MINQVLVEIQAVSLQRLVAQRVIINFLTLKAFPWGVEEKLTESQLKLWRRALERNLYVQWGLAAGMYSGLTYGLKEARGVHDWKYRALAGAITGAALAATSEDHSHEQLVHCAITGAAISTAAKLLTGVF
ncbi:Outer envelope pore protein 16-2 [Abeliophyllum distichum]|uniref:Outer envelope pore protein 16-2 n=1 Tax=Abeliophyllum distichum TaxID=126358 RepID=A0ABD1PRT4_9LAMI